MAEAPVFDELFIEVIMMCHSFQKRQKPLGGLLIFRNFKPFYKVNKFSSYYIRKITFFKLFKFSPNLEKSPAIIINIMRRHALFTRSQTAKKRSADAAFSIKSTYGINVQDTLLKDSYENTKPFKI